LWLYTVLGCIGESFEEGESDEVCGAVVSVRKSNDKIALWTRNAKRRDLTERVGVLYKKALELLDGDKLGYQTHEDAMRRNSSWNNSSRYTV